MVALAKPDNRITRNNEWFTPARYVEAAREVMGRIDLDPASCALANETIRAIHYYTKEDDGLQHAWHGNIWLNPPFGRMNASLTTRFGGGKSIMGLFVEKLLQEYQSGNVTQAILLATPKIDTAWFRPLWEHPICFATHRVIFRRPEQPDQGHFYGTCFIYLGSHEHKFIETFSQFGRIAKAIDTPRKEVAPIQLWEVK